MRCAKCGTENPVGKKFCGECGNAFSMRCPKCGAENTPPFRFCGECGTALARNPASAAGPSLQNAILVSSEPADAGTAHPLWRGSSAHSIDDAQDHLGAALEGIAADAFIRLMRLVEVAGTAYQ